MRRADVVLAALVLAAFVSPAVAAEPVGGERAFSFVALGDMPYSVPADYARFDRLIAAVNRLRPAFSIHVGDTKSGSTACTDAAFQTVLDQFRTFEQPLVYAIGDNEWTDCHRTGSDPRERLARVRQMFFPDPEKSLGRAPMAVESQARAMPEFARHVENARFAKNDVLFVTLHVVGSNNGFETFDPAAATEYFERNRANLAWLAASFAKARESHARAVVVAFQANLWDIRDSVGTIPPASGFRDTIVAIEREARAFAKPVLVIQGDYHTLEVTGFRDTRMRLVPGIQRLQVMGETEVHAVRVVVDPDMPGVFSFVPLIVPENETP
ncbi:hypothetical protein [Rhodoplanes roseus]|uniref:Calcineurin-like phosphoesterase domain-containing protein n=1 Tax=Rhodoplanes roseus TaxID=29409 RepID=A0A327L2G8_9BRAD|nr:hypothetical protein [Rhodoplanes roseus]RAI41888.1 hypothetical protein CH341_20685 [Rhodoplanes roseus]